MPVQTNPKPPKGMAEFNEFYGNPTLNGRLNPEWEAANIIAITPPYPMRYAFDKSLAITRIRCHRKVAESLRAVLQAIEDECRLRMKQKHGFDKTTEFYDGATIAYIQSLRLDLYGGCFNYRLKRGGKTLSVHSYGAAIDLDPDNNGMGDQTPTMPLWVVTIWESHGWLHGIRWKGASKDSMHSQYGTGY